MTTRTFDTLDGQTVQCEWLNTEEEARPDGTTFRRRALCGHCVEIDKYGGSDHEPHEHCPFPHDGTEPEDKRASFILFAPLDEAQSTITWTTPRGTDQVVVNKQVSEQLVRNVLTDISIAERVFRAENPGMTDEVADAVTRAFEHARKEVERRLPTDLLFTLARLNKETSK